MQNFNRGVPLIQIKDVSLVLSGNQILRNMNAVVTNITRPDLTDTQTGQGVAFLGPSGYGKTQFSLCLTGAQSPTTGEILVGVDGLPVQRGGVGMVTQDYQVFNHRTVFKNLHNVGRKAGLGYREAKEKALDFLETLGLMAEKDKYPLFLSGGQRQRVAILQQLMAGHHFIVMDEPLSGLDARNKRVVCDLIYKVLSMDDINTFVIVSHEIPTTLAVCDEVWILGKDRDENGVVVPGAYIKHHFDLKDMDLCWRNDPERPIQKEPRFIEFVNHITFDIFPTL